MPSLPIKMDWVASYEINNSHDKRRRPEFQKLLDGHHRFALFNGQRQKNNARENRGGLAANQKEVSMGQLKIEGITHWSIPVNNLDEAEKFYGDLLGLNARGRLGNSGMSCFSVGDQNILLCERAPGIDKSHTEEQNVHHSFTVSPETLVQACKIFQERKVPIDRLYYRAKGFFTGRELYFFDPSGNRLELRDPTWKAGMPEPTFEELARS
jgi:catechol 2,3-dioxygenase-like lactoylglutathione lyase family enzyme